MRKQMNFTEQELDVIITALQNEWWFKYDPLIEVSVRPYHDLLHRISLARENLQARTTSVLE
jgi:hypothetical protein|tara:strand:+ start:222 stop:407 length:186 start_codon:yes stop_codon:yes gene_type:complete